MPGGPDADDSERGAPPKLSLMERLRQAIVKPADPSAPHAEVAPARTVDELEAEVRSADDKERLLGLLGAPVGAAIATVITSAQLANDPAHYLANGLVNPHYVSVSQTHELLLVLLALSALMLVMAWLRKRLFLGIAMALYGVSVFNLHWWGFGVPYLMAGAWLLVRAYRLNRSLREATAGGPRASGPSAPPKGRSPAAGATKPPPNKRYTPKTATKRPAPPKSGEQKAG